MATTAGPVNLIPNLVHFAESFIAAHGAGYPDGMAASLVAEENVRKLYARHGQRISDVELRWIGAEVIMAYNRAEQAAFRRQCNEAAEDQYAAHHAWSAV